MMTGGTNNNGTCTCGALLHIGKLRSIEYLSLLYITPDYKDYSRTTYGQGLPILTLASTSIERDLRNLEAERVDGRKYDVPGYGLPPGALARWMVMSWLSLASAARAFNAASCTLTSRQRRNVDDARPTRHH